MKPGIIYVETLIRVPMDRLWQYTQDPALHRRWDLRFTDITYIPKSNEGEPQRFRYATRIGFGLCIAGTGESRAEVALPDGSRVSSLRFGSADPKSLIREGSGYWKYTPEPAGVRFMTSYDYDVRFGALGRAVDGMAFRPLLGWATAWSFDALRLWLERGLEPEHARRVAFVRVAAGVAAAAFLAAGAAAVRSPKWVRVAIPAAGLIALTRWLRVPSNDRPSARRCRRAPVL